MARDPNHDILFEPIQIGPKTLPNRFYQVPHCTGAGSEKPGFQAANRAMKAEGGWGAVNTEYCSIHPESDDTMRVSARIWDEGDVRNLSVMTEAVHAQGALTGIELWYGGAHAPSMESRSRPRGPSGLSSDFEVDSYARVMDKNDIRTTQGYYVEAAKRARRADFDIIYLYGAHTYGPLQFLSPFYNKRTDEYGGSFENRARYWRETLEMMKEAVGDDCAIASRFSVDQLDGTGITVEGDGIRLIEHCDHLVDLWDITIGGIAEWGQDAGPSRFFPENHQKDIVGLIKAGGHTKKPVVGVGRFTNPDTMADVIRSGQLDIIGAARPSIADPFLPNKIKEGRLEDIRECIGCNMCISRWEVGGPPLICTQNATQGEEYRRGWHPEKFHAAKNSDKGVLIVGAGPAGMECAMVLGKRGMTDVHLVDAADDIGGHLSWVSTLGHGDGKSGPHRGTARGLGDWHRVIDYRKIQLDKLKNVQVHTGTKLTANEIREYGAEIVVIATGAGWATDGTSPQTREPIPGASPGAEWQLTPDEVALESKPVGKRVLVLETEAYFMGVTVAQKLAGQGHEVTIVTPLPEVAQYMDFTLEAPMMHRELHRLGVKIRANTMVESLEPGKATLYNVWAAGPRLSHDAHRPGGTLEEGDLGEAEGQTEELLFDTVVLCTTRIPNDDLYRELQSDPEALKEEGIEQVHLIGDAAAPRVIAESIFDGHRLAREIDSANPAIPLPFIRERRLWGDSTNEQYEDQLENIRDTEVVR